MNDNQKTLTNDDLLDIAKSLTGTRCTELSQIGGGLHHRVYKCKGDDHNHYLLKYYHVSNSNSEHSFINEFNSSSFMWNHGIQQIPQPINADSENRVAIYLFLRGSLIKPEEVDDNKITALTDFLSNLHSVSKIQEAAELPAADGAAFSLNQLFGSIEENVAILKQYDTGNSYGNELRQLLDEKLLPELNSQKDDLRMIYEDLELSDDDMIPYEWTTLSPSDFGFHNALLKEDGEVIFLDFESFGRDDPVKLVSDFMLNAEANLSRENYFSFLHTMVPVYTENETSFKDRLLLLFPIFTLKWCTILLNEFIPEHYEKRRKRLGNENESTILQIQFKKAEKMLSESKEVGMNLKRWLDTL